MISNQKIKGTFITFIFGPPLFFKWMGVSQPLLDCFSIGVWAVMQNIYFFILLSFVYWCPIFTSFKCSNLQFHYNFFQVSQIWPRCFLNGWGYFRHCYIVFQLEYEQLCKIYTSLSYVVFVCWSPFFHFLHFLNALIYSPITIFFKCLKFEESFPKILISRHLIQQKRTLWQCVLKNSPT